MQPETYAAGVRRSYLSLPGPVHAWVEAQLGAPVRSVQDKVGGFSPGVAAVVAGDTGRLFVKAVGSGVNAESVRLYAQEGRLSAQLPRLEGLLAPVGATQLEVEGEQYAVIVYPALDGGPPRHPWRPGDLQATLAALQRLSQHLTPSPWPPGPSESALSTFFTGWRRVAADPADPWRTDPWAGPRLTGLVAVEEELLAQLAGETLSHIDLRADNLVLTSEGVWVVDWAHAENAAPWVDAAILLSDVVASRADLADGGEIDVVEEIRRHPQLGDLPYRTVWGLQLSMAGALHAFSRTPSPPGLPTIRGWQRSTARTLLTWCERHPPRKTNVPSG